MSAVPAAVPADDGLEVVVAPMRRRHLRAVLRIEGRSQPKGWSLGLFLSELRQPTGRIYLVAKVGGAVVGYAGLLFVGTDAHVTTVSVDDAWRGRHIGTRLVAELARQAVEAGAQAMTLEVRAGNDAAIALYRRLAFAPAGVRRNYYAESDEDALVMWASDVHEPAYLERLDALEASIPGTTIVEALA